MGKTTIEWTEHSYNPITGCSHAGSPGCDFCYARRMARRLAGRCGYPKYPNHFDVTLHPDRLEQPLRRQKPTMYFVCSMSDLFHKDVPDEWRWKIFKVMAAADRHIFQVLTKRPHQMLEFCSSRWYQSLRQTYGLQGVWLGVSVENQAMADERIPLLLQIPAAVRFVSCEPLLGPIEVSPYLEGEETHGVDWKRGCAGAAVAYRPPLSWVICGGESGPNARPMHPQWARDIRDQCQVAGVPFFFKQHGAWLAHPEWVAAGSPKFTDWGCLNRSGDWFPLTTTWNGQQGEEREDFEYSMHHVGKKHAGRLLDGREWNEFPCLD